MGILIQPQRWAIKPPVGSQINWGHPLAQGLVGCWLFEKSFLNSANSVVATPSGSPGFTAGPNGTALSLVSANTQYVTIEDRIAVFPLTYVFLVNAITLPSSYNAVMARTIGGVEYALFYVKGNGTLAAYMKSGSNQLFYDGDGIHTILINKWYQLAVTWGGTGILAGYVNGELDKSVSGPTGAQAQGVTTRIGSDPGTPGREWNGLIENSLIYSRVLSQSELQWLYAEPYAFMQPMARRRFWIPTAGAGPAAYTLTADAGTYTMSGGTAALQSARRLSVNAGAFTLTGSAAALVPSNLPVLATLADVTITENLVTRVTITETLQS